MKMRELDEVRDIIEFKITDSKSIRIHLPVKKIDITAFDYIIIYYIENNNILIIWEFDYIVAGIRQMHASLSEALNENLNVFNQYREYDKYIDYGLGYYDNICSNKLWTKQKLENKYPLYYFGLWSTSYRIGINTFMYNLNGDIYLEIAPFYKWNSDEPETEEELREYTTFEEFMKNYKPIDIIKINRKTALKWKDQCKEILDIIAKNEGWESAI